MEGSRPAAPAEPGTLKTSLAATPGLVLHLAGGVDTGMVGGWAGSPGYCPPSLEKSMT